jgi:hypothetical protein
VAGTADRASWGSRRPSVWSRTPVTASIAPGTERMSIFVWLKRMVTGQPERGRPAAPPSLPASAAEPVSVPPEPRVTREEVRGALAQFGLKASVTTTEYERLASGLDHPAVVVHPSLSRGTIETYDVFIEHIDGRTERNVGNGECFADWAFRGESRCHADDARRKKTFFAPNAVRLSTVKRVRLFRATMPSKCGSAASSRSGKAPLLRSRKQSGTQ